VAESKKKSVKKFQILVDPINSRADSVAQELHRQCQRAELFAEVTLKIRQSLQLKEILRTTVSEVQRILQADRVLIYQVLADGTGKAISEAVLPKRATFSPSRRLIKQVKSRAVVSFLLEKLGLCHVCSVAPSSWSRLIIFCSSDICLANHVGRRCLPW
jgi:GAF domain-containing protein